MKIKGTMTKPLSTTDQEETSTRKLLGITEGHRNTFTSGESPPG